MSEYSRRVGQITGTLAALGRACEPDSRVLDFGCGAGNLVQAFRDAGYDAFGCDLAFKDGPEVERLSASGIIRLIDPADYRLPFEGNRFDLIVSDQVFEHVQDYHLALREISRTLTPAGATLHIFPSRLCLVEPHVHIPLAGLIQTYPWLLAWTLLGVRNANQRRMSARAAALDDLRYLSTSTNYLTRRQIRAAFDDEFDKVIFCERELSSVLADGKYRRLNRLPFGLFAWLVSTFHTRAVYAARPGPAGTSS